MGDQMYPKRVNMSQISDRITHFYEELSRTFSNAIIDTNEQLSIPELIKRLITVKQIAKKLDFKESPDSFSELGRLNENTEDNRWTGCFQGVGDKIGDYLKDRVKQDPNPDESKVLNEFSTAMMKWSEGLKHTLPPASASLKEKEGRIIYAGGDDFLGVLYSNEKPQLTVQECLNWFYQFNDTIWKTHNIPITVSVGLVWAAPGVPQRDVLQTLSRNRIFS